MIPAPANEAAPVAADTELFPASETATDITPTNEAAVTNNGLSNTTITAILIGILALIALAFVGFMSSRRRVAVKQRPVQITRPVVRPQVEPATVPAATAPIAVQPEQAMLADPIVSQSLLGTEPTPAPAVVRAENSFGSPRPQMHTSAARVSGMLASHGASVDLPARVPATYEERDALMKRMIAAKPDKANPFTDRKARTKRARLIIQSLDRDFAHTDPWIDFSQYPNNWPELARRRFPQAA